MKKSSFLILVATVVAIFSSCASSKVITLSEHSPVAVINLTSNHSIPYYSDETPDDEYGEDEGILGVSVSKFLYKESPELLTAPDRLDYAEEYLVKALEEIGGCEVVEKDTVINAEMYSKIGVNPLAKIGTKIYGEGYTPFYNIGAKKARLLMNEIGAKSLIMAEFKFQKTLVKGTKLSGQLGGRAELEIKVFNEKGKNIIMNTYTATSFDTIEIRKLNYDKDELVELFPPLIENLINQFVLEFVN